MGRNIFQSPAPQAMLTAVNAVVHKNMKPKDAYELFRELRTAKGTAAGRRLAAE
jgi:putative autoinducer-2 (AI-2) aldolase